MKYAFRSLLKSPGYTIIALLTLALGIGVNTSMFSVVDTLLFRSAPYPNPQDIVSIQATTRGGRFYTFSATEIQELRAQISGLSSLTEQAFAASSWSEAGRPAERLVGVMLSSEMGDTFRTTPLFGRPFAPDEFQPGKNHVVLLSHSFWQARFAGDRNVLGRTMRLDGETVTVVGVMPPSFDYKLMWGPVAFWRPLNYTPDQLTFRGYRNTFLVARLAAGLSAENIVAQLSPLVARWEKEFPQEYSGLKFQVRPLHEAAMDSTGRAISWMLLGLSGFVLLIACANLANLQLARATTALRDFAIRAALGATRGRLIAQQLTECVIVSVAGGALGFVVALWINSLIERSILIGNEASFKIATDTRVLVATLLVALVTGVLFGIVPAIFASRTDVVATLKSQGRGSTSGRGHHRMRHALIVGEVALALVLLGGAALMNRGFTRLLQRQVGWDTAQVVTGTMPLPEKRYTTPEKRIDFFRKLEDRLALLPGAEHVALSTAVPLFGYYNDHQVFADAEFSGRNDNPTASFVMITPDYFATLGIPLREGRLFARDLERDGPPYIIINESLARRFWPKESAIGKRIGSTQNKEIEWREVIGVVADVEPVANVANPSTSLTVYKPLVQEPWSYANVLVRSRQPAALREAVRRVVSELDPDLPLDRVGTVPQLTDEANHNLIVIAKILVGFAALGLALAAVGLYGVISHIVAQRTSEFGIRLALGAEPRDILRHVLARGLWLTGIGLAVGLAGAWGLSRFLGAFMPRLVSADPLGLLMVSALLFVVAALASLIPARRATKVDPLIALRAE